MPAPRLVSLKGSDFTGLGIECYGGLKDGIYVKKVAPQGPASGLILIGMNICYLFLLNRLLLKKIKFVQIWHFSFNIFFCRWSNNEPHDRFSAHCARRRYDYLELRFTLQRAVGAGWWKQQAAVIGIIESWINESEAGKAIAACSSADSIEQSIRSEHGKHYEEMPISLLHNYV